MEKMCNFNSLHNLTKSSAFWLKQCCYNQRRSDVLCIVTVLMFFIVKMLKMFYVFGQPKSRSCWRLNMPLYFSLSSVLVLLSSLLGQCSTQVLSPKAY